jgi:threonine aldolase
MSHYRENMFTVREYSDRAADSRAQSGADEAAQRAERFVQGDEYVLKPMNCPFHMLMYNSTRHSYRDLPLRIAEMGTVYTIEELKTLCDFSHSNNLYVHLDGSRLANACAYLNVGLRELSRNCGIDILSLGGTKNGMMIGETIISFRPEWNERLMYLRKQSAQLYSKMRYLSAQYIAYFKDGLWLQNAAHSNAMANYLAGQIRDLPEVRLTQKVEVNSLFLILPQAAIKKMLESYFFYMWDENANEIRLVCSWDTTQSDVDAFVKQLKTTL